jgi:predicted HTH domain antitoxin
MTLSIQLADEALRALSSDPDEAAAEVRMAAAAKLYELGRISSGAAAELAGLQRVAFLARLKDFGVSAMALSEAELVGDAARA